ncbi:unnamed protein product [Hymenolepis diminuta]|uniref:WD_REPEATS_REGION domain-containing protein n=2 Tax=Hymenolepis diminuta TaxID=6216 RepID=A0A0R3SFJ7_HYMDI|nr:unnamed protein product [Hymenolepis diminuta]
MGEGVQSRKLEKQVEVEGKELFRSASRGNDGRTSALYEPQSSNEERDYFSNLPKLAIKGIIKYLDDESLFACYQFVIMPVPHQPALLIGATTLGRIHIWGLDDGRQFPHFRVLSGHESVINSLATSTKSSKPQTPDERCLFVSGSYDNTVRLWNALTGQCLRVFVVPNCTAVAFCDDWIISGDLQGNIHTHQIDGVLSRSVRKCRHPPVEIHYDGKWIVSVSTEYITIFNTEDHTSTTEIQSMFPKGYECVIIDLVAGEIIYCTEYNLHVYNLKAQKDFPFQIEFGEFGRRLVDIKAVETFIFAAMVDDEILLFDRRNRTLIHKIAELPYPSVSKSNLAVTESRQTLLYIRTGVIFPSADRMYVISVKQPN